MRRYAHIKNSKLINTHENDPHFNTTGINSAILPAIRRTSSDPVIIAKTTDRLDNFAFKYYKDTSMWWVIALANNLPGDSIYIEPGTQIFIPQNLHAYQEMVRTINRE